MILRGLLRRWSGGVFWIAADAKLCAQQRFSLADNSTECSMNRYPLISAASLLATLALASACTHAPSAPSTPDSITAAVADANRPAADAQRDANRKPAETLVFAGVRPGEQIGELVPGAGYFTRI